MLNLFYIIIVSQITQVFSIPEPPFDYEGLEGPNYNFNIYNDDISSHNSLQNYNPSFALRNHLNLRNQFGAQCDNKQRECDTSRHFECIDGKCQCQNPNNRHYDPKLQQCVSLSRTSCGNKIFNFNKNDNKQPKSCTENAECRHGICQCFWGYSATRQKTCKLNHGQPCQANECNEDQGLACRNSVCQCKDSTSIYKIISARCADPQQEIDGFVRLIGRAVVVNSVNTVAGGIAGEVARTFGRVAVTGLTLVG